MKELIDYSEPYGEFSLTGKGWVAFPAPKDTTTYAVQFHRSRRHILRKGVKDEFFEVVVTGEPEIAKRLLSKYGDTRDFFSNARAVKAHKLQEEKKARSISQLGQSFLEMASLLDEPEIREAFCLKVNHLMARYVSAPLGRKERIQGKRFATQAQLKQHWGELYFSYGNHHSITPESLASSEFGEKILSLSRNGQLDKIEQSFLERYLTKS